MRWRTGALLAGCLGCSSGGGGSPFGTADTDASSSVQRDDAAEPSSVPEASGDDASQFVGPSGSSTDSISCQAGTYVGTYSGTDDSSKVGGPTNFPISGPMQLNLVRTEEENGEFDLVTNNGSFDMTWGGLTTGDAASGLIVVHGAISGQLQCSSGDFTAMSTSATWTLIGLNAGTATMNFTGKYDPSSSSISGNFVVTSSIATSMGTWTVTLTPQGDP
jgi:hypothetical protein